MGWTRPHQAALCWLLGQDKPTREVSLTLRGMGAGVQRSPRPGAHGTGAGGAGAASAPGGHGASSPEPSLGWPPGAEGAEVSFRDGSQPPCPSLLVPPTSPWGHCHRLPSAWELDPACTPEPKAG